MFNVRDKVRLISGGPVMTVSVIVDNDSVECVWSDKRNNDFKTDTFLSAILEKVEEKSEGGVFVRNT